MRNPHRAWKQWMARKQWKSHFEIKKYNVTKGAFGNPAWTR
ncbi:hypothetical protein LCGC14_2598890 [marine sediment metagenome]|uniref:Uncharacterized protein n=1 Tax=marine sediment metagenome TaxID=412755 RepID=A0A0F9D210_9ZZZZ